VAIREGSRDESSTSGKWQVGVDISGCSLLVGTGSVVVADMSTCNLHLPLLGQAVVAGQAVAECSVHVSGQRVRKTRSTISTSASGTWPWQCRTNKALAAPGGVKREEAESRNQAQLAVADLSGLQCWNAEVFSQVWSIWCLVTSVCCAGG
jgi:hypothetical protein